MQTLDHNIIRKSLEKLFNKLLVSKYPQYIERVRIRDINEFSKDIRAEIIIHITPLALKKCYEYYLMYEDDPDFDINDYAQETGELEQDFSDLLDINVYLLLQEIMGYVITHKNPHPSYYVTAKKIEI